MPTIDSLSSKVCSTSSKLCSTSSKLCDRVFIDADHSKRGCEADIRAWAPKVKPSGWVCGHDWQFPEVRWVLDDLLPKWQAHDHQCWRIRRADVEL